MEFADCEGRETVSGLIDRILPKLNFLNLRRFDYSSMNFHEDIDARVLFALPRSFDFLNQCYLYAPETEFPRLVGAIGVNELELDELCLRYSQTTKPTAIKLSLAFGNQLNR